MTGERLVLMTTEVKLTRQYAVVFDGSGNGSQLITVDSVAEVWRPFHLTTRTNSQVAPFPSCDMYSGPDTTGILIDTTSNCSRASTGRIGSVVITSHIPVFLKFVGGNPNDTLIIGLFGTKVIP